MIFKSVRLTLAAVGALKEPYWRAAQAEYVKRIRRYAPLALAEVKDRVGSGLLDAEAMRREGEELLTAAKGCTLVALTPEGETLTTDAWAPRLARFLETHSRVAFLIGGPLGLAGPVRASSPWRLSLSPMTFPHELARVVFLEQLYRAFTILAGEKYHK